MKKLIINIYNEIEEDLGTSYRDIDYVCMI